MPAIAVRIEPLRRDHERGKFSCGVPDLDDYLRQRASQDLRNHVAACYVLTVSRDWRAVHGYYTLSSYAIELRDLPANVSRRLPKYPRVPAAILGRLAVDKAAQGRGFGELLLVDAMRRTVEIAAEIGLYALVVDARDAEATGFYRRYGFSVFPGQPLRLFLPIKTLGIAFASK